LRVQRQKRKAENRIIRTHYQHRMAFDRYVPEDGKSQEGPLGPQYAAPHSGCQLPIPRSMWYRGAGSRQQQSADDWCLGEH
jgi:hypothetical protein